jgi:hypothetical protein
VACAELSVEILINGVVIQSRILPINRTFIPSGAGSGVDNFFQKQKGASELSRAQMKPP